MIADGVDSAKIGWGSVAGTGFLDILHAEGMLASSLKSQAGPAGPGDQANSKLPNSRQTDVTRNI
jgi:hypothetical protein